MTIWQTANIGKEFQKLRPNHEANGDLRRITPQTNGDSGNISFHSNGDLRKISVYTNGDLRYTLS